MRERFVPWVGQEVVLQLAIDNLNVPLRGLIIRESETAIRFRVDERWEIDIYKSMILAIGQDDGSDRVC